MMINWYFIRIQKPGNRDRNVNVRATVGELRKTLSWLPATAFSRSKWYPSTPGKIHISNTSRNEERR
jgi:hypothetical protein